MSGWLAQAPKGPNSYCLGVCSFAALVACCAVQLVGGPLRSSSTWWVLSPDLTRTSVWGLYLLYALPWLL